MDRAAIGELVFSNSDTNQPEGCTATVVQSASQSAIITAGHCVKSFTTGKLYTNFSFAPDHTGPTCLNLATCGTNPDGVWTADSTDIVVDSRFSASEQRLDVAFLIVHPASAGQASVQVAVGGVPLEYNANASGSWTSYGYPIGNAPDPTPNPTSFVQCIGVSSADPGDVSGTIGPVPLLISACANSGLTGGSSGGPWIDTQTGKIGAINKACCTKGTQPVGMLGDQLGSEVQQLYQSLPTTPATQANAVPAWGFPFRPGLTVNIGLPENHPNSRLHDANYDTITDDTTNKTYTLGQGDGSDYASLDMGVYGGSISSQDVSDENALALATGKVLAVEAACNAVLIDYSNGWWGIYLHLDSNRIWVAAGDTVAAGTPIGVPTVNVGGCGQDTSFQHVHFALLHNGQYVSMRGMQLCGHTVTDDGLQGVQTVPPTPPQPTPAPFTQNIIFKVPANCPAERPETNIISTNTSAGYRVLTGGIKGIRAEWVMPTVSGASGTAMNVAIDLGAWQGDVQNHPETEMAIFTFGAVQSDGTTQYTTAANIANSQQDLNVPLAAGDRMSASIINTGGTSNNWTLTLSNLTQGKQATLTTTITDDETLPTFDIGPSTSASGLANFTAVQYGHPQIQLASGEWVDLSTQPYQATQFIENNQTVAKAGPVSATGFTVTRINLSA